MKDGMVFNIQKFSIHDGPGIRTTVFLKGCPLRCRWCANPESQKIGVQISWDDRRCLQCGSCINLCPAQALEAEGSVIRLHPERCRGCLKCVAGCPGRALKAEGELRSAEEVVMECLEDRDFYEESRGGVTISGGEGMIQPEFVRRLTDLLHQNKIHTAIETTGAVSKEVFEDLAPRFDLLLFDLKHPDSKAHQKGTGEGNERILGNLKWAADHHLEVLVRIPVIPGFNDSPEDAAGFAGILQETGLRRVQLLPFHQMGQNKYHLLQKSYDYESARALYPEDLQEFAEVFQKHEIEAFF